MEYASNRGGLIGRELPRSRLSYRRLGRLMRSTFAPVPPQNSSKMSFTRICASLHNRVKPIFEECAAVLRKVEDYL